MKNIFPAHPAVSGWERGTRQREEKKGLYYRMEAFNMKNASRTSLPWAHERP